MKKSLVILTFAFTTVFANAQCIPDPQYVGGGIYPDSITGLSDAYVGQSYNQLITIITPPDTVFLGFPATIVSIDLDFVSGLPPNFTYNCDPASCSFPGGSTKCAEVYSTIDPTASDVGFYPISFECTAFATIPFIGGTTLTFVESGYAIEIVDNTTSVLHQFNDQSFEFISIVPNPVINQAQIKFIAGKSDDIIFRIYNLLGRQVYLRKFSAIGGINSIDINAAIFQNGIYMYSINNGKNIITKRMIISH